MTLPSLPTQSVRALDPRDHIDRVAEQELFRDVVTYRSSARILTICDRGGRGKSSLLKRLVYNCEHEIRPAVPSCLLELDKLTGDPTPFAFALAVRDGFNVRGEDVSKRFERFTSLDRARAAKDFTPFDDGSGGNRASRQFGRSEVGVQHGGKAAGIMVENAEEVNVAAPPDFTEDQERVAKEACVEALFRDLREICETRPMVLLLDGWDKCNLTLRSWIFDDCLGGQVLHPDPAMRPDKLGVVLAGRPFEPGETPHGLRIDELRPHFDTDDDFDSTVRSIKSLSEWETEHIREFMVLNGCPEPSDAEVNVIREQLSKGRSLEKIVSLIDDHFRS